MSASKKAKREAELKKAKRNKIITVISVAAAILILAGAIIFNNMRSAGTETYSDGEQFISLRADGSFSAALYHGVQYSGTYERASGGINLTYDGQQAFAAIQGGALNLPEEWGDDGHGHGSTLMKR
jgi:ABC-type phosphate transport system substrate-binding protein